MRPMSSPNAPQAGLRKLLWERLTGDCPPRTHRQSIQEELDLLFNTRRFRIPDEEAERTVLDYGMATLEMIKHRHPVLAVGIELEIQAVIQSFEPRLQHVQVEVLPDLDEEGRTQVHISGQVQLETQMEHFRFPMTLS